MATKNNEDFGKLRARFDAAGKAHALSPATTLRYRSWIRRFIVFCRRHHLPLTSESVQAFLQTYRSRTTRRQAFFALKFFLVVVMEISSPDGLSQYRVPGSNTWTKSPKKKWWNPFEMAKYFASFPLVAAIYSCWRPRSKQIRSKDR